MITNMCHILGDVFSSVFYTTGQVLPWLTLPSVFVLYHSLESDNGK